MLGSTLAWMALGAGAVSATASTPVEARVARNLSIHETGSMYLVGHPEGRIINERGTISGTYRGSIEARLVTFTNTTGEATLTAYTSGGSLKLKAATRGRPEKGEEAIGHFYGTATVTGGTGRWAHASGHMAFSGSVDRRNLRVTAEMRGTLHV